MPERELGRGRTAPFFLVRSFKVRHYPDFCYIAPADNRDTPDRKDLIFHMCVDISRVAVPPATV